MKRKRNISAVSGRSDRNKMATINMSISIRNLQHLKKVVDALNEFQKFMLYDE